MAYNWAQLAFVEKWRLRAVRGVIVGMYRPADKTFFDLRLRPGEGGAASIPAPVELHLQDAGDLIREKRVGLLEKPTVVVRVVASSARPVDPSSTAAATEHGKRRLEAGSTVSGRLISLDDGEGVVDIGFPVVVQFQEGADLPTETTVEITVGETPKGFLVL